MTDLAEQPRSSHFTQGFYDELPDGKQWSGRTEYSTIPGRVNISPTSDI
jgi:hypothetical protein